MDVERALSVAEIVDDFEPVAGDCVSIANAIHSVFGGTLVAVSTHTNSRSIDHAAVRIDGTLYDGRGAVTEDQICREFARGSNPSPRNHVWEPSTIDTQHFRGFVYEKVKGRLEEVLEEDAT